MGEHVVKRGTDVFNGRKFIPGYYLITTWLSLFPWLGFIVPVWRLLRSNRTSATAFLAAWFLAPQVIFFLYATQLPHYVMPGYPGFIVLLAVAWHQRHSSSRARDARLAIALTGILAVLLATAWVATQTIEIQHAAIHELSLIALAVLTLVLVAGGAVACMVWRKGDANRLAWVAGAAIFLIGASLVPLGRALRARSVPVKIASHLRDIPPQTVLHGCGYTEPSLVFYTDHPWRFTDAVHQAKERLDAEDTMAVVVLKREWTLDRWWKSLWNGNPAAAAAAKDHSVFLDGLLKRSPDVEFHVIEGFNMARFSWVEIVLLLKH
jgi:4-amino-4-deoxy-L-arabinose transferase-like glycosyltransferase